MDYRILKKAAEENDPEAAYKEIGREFMRLEMKIAARNAAISEVTFYVSLIAAGLALVALIISLV